MQAVAKMPEVSKSDVNEAAKALEKVGSSTFPGAVNGSVGGPLDPGGVKNQSASSDDDIDDPMSTENKSDANQTVKVPKPNDEINGLILSAIEEISGHKAVASAANAEIKAVIEILEAKGVNRHAFRYACKVLEMNDSQREGLDLSYMLVRQAGGAAVQTDWLDDKKTH
ncbi:MAG: hypothetical protein L3J16_06710 [Anaerolineales bacterium]|nr:hypothetical protein [Anaerolineales bacterium]